MMRSLDVLATEAAPEKFIAEMLRTIGQRLRAQTVLLWLRNQDNDSLHLRLVIEDGQQVAPHLDHPFVKDPQAWKGQLPFQEMIFTKSPVVCDDVERDPSIDGELREYMMKRGCKKFLAIPMFVLGELRGFIGIQHVEQGTYRAEEIELAQALAHHVIMATHETELGEQQRRAAVLEERTRMARDIHDTLAQGFTAIVVHLQAAEDATAKGLKKDAQKHLQTARDLARQSLAEARRSVHALRPQVLEDTFFWDALKRMIKKSSAGTALLTKFQMRGHPRDLPALWQQNLLHIGQEALTNTLKHARASRFVARLNLNKKELRLELEDDGEGFTPTDRHDGFGLIGMRERVEQMGGTLTVVSSPEQGTNVTVVARYVN
jgi:signal transduction histidine kinase